MKKYLLRYKKENAILLFLLIFINGIETSSAFLQMYIGKQVMESKFEKVLVAVAFSSALMYILNVLFYIRKNYQTHLIARMNTDFRNDISKKILRESFETNAGTDTGEYLSWYTNDVREAENQGFQVFYSCMNIALSLLMGSISLIFIKWELLAVTLTVSSISMYVSTRFSDKVEKYAGKVSVAMERYTDKVKEQIAGIGVLKAFGNPNKFHKEIMDAGEAFEKEKCDFAKNKGKENYKSTVISILGINVINILTFVLCVLRIISPEIIFGSLNLTNQVGNAFEQLIQARLQIAGSRPYFAKVECENILAEKRYKQKLPALEKEIVLEKLTFSYGEKKVFENINYTFEKNGKYALVGKSGSGKTTLMKILLGQLGNYQGKVYYDGVEMSSFDVATYYEQIAYIEQNVFLFDCSIRENITLGSDFPEGKMQEALKMSALQNDMNAFPDGLDTKVGENGKNLSGGQKQRVAIARALIHNRTILFVDEGTSALDKENAAVVEEALLACPTLTLILITHHLKKDTIPLYDKVYSL